MEGLKFVREDHLVIAEGCYLPRADLLGHIQSHLHEILFRQPELKNYIPQMLDVDLFVSWDGEKFMFFLSPEKRGQLPARGMDTKFFPAQREAGQDRLAMFNGFLDVSELDGVKQSFAQMGFAPGFAAVGTFPAELYTEEAKVAKVAAGKEIATLIQTWAQARLPDVN